MLMPISNTSSAQLELIRSHVSGEVIEQEAHDRVSTPQVRGWR